jgi:hypothetical protein
MCATADFTMYNMAEMFVDSVFSHSSSDISSIALKLI